MIVLFLLSAKIPQKQGKKQQKNKKKHFGFKLTKHKESIRVRNFLFSYLMRRGDATTSL